MPEIFSNQQGVQLSAQRIGTQAHGAAQLVGNHNAQSDTHQSGVDGGARLGARELNRIVRQAVEETRETVDNLRTFMENSAQTTTSLDQTRGASIEQLQIGGTG